MLDLSKARTASLFVTLAVTVVLGVQAGTGVASAQQTAGEDRSAASVRALRYGFAAHDRKDLVVEGKRYASIDVPYRREESVDLVAQEGVDGLVDASPDVEREVDLVEDPPPSARAGTRLGEVMVKVDGKKIGETQLVAMKGYEETSLGQRVWYTVGGIFE